MSANDRTGVGAGSAEWGTPPDLYRRLDRRFLFTYDAFASHDNMKAGLYSTVEGTFRRNEAIPKGNPIPFDPRDGLNHPWGSHRVFMNPPYSRGLIEQCIEKAYEESKEAALIVALLPAATETRWFQRFILPHCHIDFLQKRVRYIDPATGEPGQSPPSGAVIAVFRTELMP